MKAFVSISLFLASAWCLASTVCIDPGHPSEIGSGATGKKISEIRAAWKVALLLKKELEAAGVDVVMTKKSEKEFVKNKDRSAIANKAHVDLMVRLHCDSAEGSGFAVYIPKRRGTAQGKTGPSQEVLDACGKVGPIFHKELASQLKGKLKDNGLLPDTATAVGGKNGALIGSIFSEVPVVLVEMCRLSNPHDDEFMASAAGQKAMAKALAKATIKAINVKK